MAPRRNHTVLTENGLFRLVATGVVALIGGIGMQATDGNPIWASIGMTGFGAMMTQVPRMNED